MGEDDFYYYSDPWVDNSSSYDSSASGPDNVNPSVVVSDPNSLYYDPSNPAYDRSFDSSARGPDNVNPSAVVSDPRSPFYDPSSSAYNPSLDSSRKKDTGVGGITFGSGGGSGGGSGQQSQQSQQPPATQKTVVSTSKLANGQTRTVYSDGSVTVTGTPTAGTPTTLPSSSDKLIGSLAALTQSLVGIVTPAGVTTAGPPVSSSASRVLTLGPTVSTPGTATVKAGSTTSAGITAGEVTGLALAALLLKVAFFS